MCIFSIKTLLYNLKLFVNTTLWKKKTMIWLFGDLFSFFFLIKYWKKSDSHLSHRGFLSFSLFQYWSSSTFMKKLSINHLLILSSEYQVFLGSMSHWSNQTNWRSSKLLFGWARVNLLPRNLYSTVFTMRMLITHPLPRCYWAMLTLSQELQFLMLPCPWVGGDPW